MKSPGGIRHCSLVNIHNERNVWEVSSFFLIKLVQRPFWISPLFSLSEKNEKNSAKLLAKENTFSTAVSGLAERSPFFNRGQPRRNLSTSTTTRYFCKLRCCFKLIYLTSQDVQNMGAVLKCTFYLTYECLLLFY